MRKCKLYFFHHAGGAASNYLSWKKFFGNEFELCPIDLPGRGSRFQEGFCENMEYAVEDIYNKISPQFEENSYAFFGHSMGTIVEYELMKKIIKNKLREPLHIFFSGRFPPYVVDKKEPIHSLPEDEFINEILKHGGTSSDIFQNKELKEIFMPILRADYKLVETYKYSVEIEPVNIDVSILNGRDDENVKNNDIERWKEYSLGNCNFYEFDGGHFYLNSHKSQIAKIINNTLSILLSEKYPSTNI